MTKNIYNDDILVQSYRGNMSYGQKSSFKKFLNSINYSPNIDYNNNIFHDNHITKELGEIISDKEILDDLKELIDSGKAKSWDILTYLKLKKGN